MGAVTNLNGLADAKFVCAGRDLSFIIDSSGKLRATHRTYATEFNVVDVGVKFKSAVNHDYIYDCNNRNCVCFVIDENDDLWNVEKPTIFEKEDFLFTDVTTRPELQLKKVGLKARDISSSGDDVACVSTEGIVYFWSTYIPWQDGLDCQGKPPKAFDPTKIETSEEMAKVAMGTDHLLTLGISGTVYSSGKNNLGQLGRPKASTFSLWKPVKVEFPRVQTIIQIAASGAHSVALTASGLVYVWGKSLTSQSSIYTPTCVDLYFGSVDHVAIQSISLSVNLTYKYGTAYTPHILALTQDNKVYAWGKDSRGQCGVRIGFFIFRAFLNIIGYCLKYPKMKAL